MAQEPVVIEVFEFNMPLRCFKCIGEQANILNHLAQDSCHRLSLWENYPKSSIKVFFFLRKIQLENTTK